MAASGYRRLLTLDSEVNGCALGCVSNDQDGQGDAIFKRQ
jgi:hypothetical protein